MWDFSLSVVFTINLSKARHKWYKADMALIPQKNVYAVVRMFHSRYRRQLLQIERELGPAPLPRRQRGEHWQKEDLLWDCINKFKEQSFTKEGCLEFLDNIARLIHAVDSIWKKARSASHKKPVCSGSDQSCKPAADALYASSRATGAIEERSRRYEEKRSRRCKEKISCSEAQCPCCQERRGPAEVTWSTANPLFRCMSRTSVRCPSTTSWKGCGRYGRTPSRTTTPCSWSKSTLIYLIFVLVFDFLKLATGCRLWIVNMQEFAVNHNARFIIIGG